MNASLLAHWGSLRLHSAVWGCDWMMIAISGSIAKPRVLLVVPGQTHGSFLASHPWANLWRRWLLLVVADGESDKHTARRCQPLWDVQHSTFFLGDFI
jgi:hypothetical protein